MVAKFNRQDVVLGGLITGRMGSQLNSPLDWEILPSGAAGYVLTTNADGSIAWLATSSSYWMPPAVSWFPYFVHSDPITGIPTVSTSSQGNALDVASLAPTGGTTYYVGYAGASDSNTGTSVGQSLLNLSTAAGKSDVGTIYINTGLHTRVSGTLAAAPTRSISVIASPDGVTRNNGTATLSAHDALAWSLASSATSTYTAARTNVTNVWDSKTLDANGDNVQLANNSGYGGTGDLTAGQWYSNGTNVWVRTSDSRSLVGDTYIRVYLSVYCVNLAGPTVTYLENLSCEGGNHPIGAQSSTNAATTIYAKNCAFKYASATNNGFGMLGTISIAQNCVAAQNGLDGFNYHEQGSYLCKAIEINCIGRNNGWAGGDSNNGSTTHDGNSVVRINGLYWGNDGPNVVDVGANTASWSVGCGAWGSTAGTGSVQNSNYQSQCSGTGGMWLDSCWGHSDPSSAAKYQMSCTTSGYLYFRKFSGEMAFSVDSTSTLQSY